jgi:adenosylcobinamide-GDP ribazoletransferase
VQFSVATFTTVVALAIAGLRAVGPTCAALGVALGIAVWLRRRLGGLTGDVYGATIELAELTFLVAASVV